MPQMRAATANLPNMLAAWEPAGISAHGSLLDFGAL